MSNNPWLRQKKMHSAPQEKKLGSTDKRKWKILPILWIAFKKTAMVIGAIVILGSLLLSWMFSSVIGDEIDTGLPSQMVLYMELDGAVGDLPKESSLVDPFVESGKTVKNYIDAIEQAKTDSRVEGIYASLGNVQLSLAHVQELRIAIKDFRESGKFAYIYSSSYSGGLGSYYLASAFDEMWMQPMGVVVLSGLNAEMPFLRGVLDVIGVEPQMFKRKEFKGAYDMFTEHTMPDASREAMQSLITDLSDILTRDIAEDKGISELEFRGLVNNALFLSEDALAHKLIDRVEYSDILVGHINKKVTGDPENENLAYIEFNNYMKDMLENRNGSNSIIPPVTKSAEKPVVALIYAVGAIMDSDTTGSSTSIDDGIAGADEISKALIKAANDDTIDAVVLRVDSPGGSPVASETILRAVEKIQMKGKTVTVSMGPTAASGGYWISAYADEIFVMPTTITGSIGVLGGKFSLQKMWQNLNVNWESVTWGENAAMWSMNTPFSESEGKRVEAMIDHIYDNFVERVAKGRDMTEEQVEAVARGRVWSGKAAVRLGLADQIGGLNSALDYAAVQTGQENRNDVEIKILPKPLTAVEHILKLLEGQVRIAELVQIQAHIVERFIPDVRMLSLFDNKGSVLAYEPMNVQ